MSVDSTALSSVLAGINIKALAAPLPNFILNLQIVGKTLIIKSNVPLSSFDDLQQEVLQIAQTVEPNISKLSLEYAAPVAHNNQAGLDGVKNTIVVASGKGGVGKSTTSVT